MTVPAEGWSSLMQLKSSYSAREVAALTGLSARQLQWWDTTRIFASAISPRRTAQGGFTERRYSPMDVLELMALAGLRREGFAPSVLRQMMDTLRDVFRRRLSETLDDAGDLRLLTDGRGLFLLTQQGHIFDLLVDPQQPLITGDGLKLRKVRSTKYKVRNTKKPTPRTATTRSGTR